MIFYMYVHYNAYCCVCWFCKHTSFYFVSICVVVRYIVVICIIGVIICGCDVCVDVFFLDYKCASV